MTAIRVHHVDFDVAIAPGKESDPRTGGDHFGAPSANRVLSAAADGGHRYPSRCFIVAISLGLKGDLCPFGDHDVIQSSLG
jgi:hypothetical protein